MNQIIFRIFFTRSGDSAMARMAECASLFVIFTVNLSYAHVLTRVMGEGNEKGMWLARATCPFGKCLCGKFLTVYRQRHIQAYEPNLTFSDIFSIFSLFGAFFFASTVPFANPRKRLEDLPRNTIEFPVSERFERL